MTIPKIAVLATGLAAAVLVATINPAPAEASPDYASTCSSCHTAGGTLTATPSSATLAPGASFTVALAFTGGSGSSTGYWISGNGANLNGSGTSATMTAPAAAGTYTYTAWFRQSVTDSATFSITVAPVVTTPPTTVPPTTVPPTTVPPTTVPPTTVPPTTVPPTTTPPTDDDDDDDDGYRGHRSQRDGEYGHGHGRGHHDGDYRKHHRGHRDDRRC